jgi:hypothetical protein
MKPTLQTLMETHVIIQRFQMTQIPLKGETMEQKQPASVYLKRRMLARDYLAQIPAEVINLDDWVQPREEVAIGGRKPVIEAHLQANGLDALKCGSVACLAGWLWTMPEYKEWSLKACGQPMHDSHALRAWLGLDRYDPCHEEIFSAARGCYYDDGVKEGTSDKDLALNRLDHIIKEALPHT